MQQELGAKLFGQVRRWIREEIPGGEVEEVRILKGGTSSTLCQINVKTRSGLTLRTVLRLHDNEEWLAEEPDVVRHEATSLEWAGRAGLPAPRPIALDETGERCGIPALLMTYLDGNVILNPKDEESWLDGMAAQLAQIHAVDAANFPWTYFTYKDIASLEIPEWSEKPLAWQKIIETVQNETPAVRQCLVHRDYHPANLLWKDGRISGIVDWPSACRGPAGVDLGHCRIDLAQLHGIATADAFLAAYLRKAGESFPYDPYWDMVALVDTLFGEPEVFPGWIALGMTGLTNELMKRRLDEYAASLVRRFYL